MKKAIIVTCLILSGLIILDSLHAGHALMMFVFAGVIPGTSLALSAEATLMVFALFIGFVLSRLLSRLQQVRYSRPKAVVLAK